MTKAELIGKMAAGAKISKAAAGKALDAFVDGVKASLKKKRGLLLLDLEPSLFLKKSRKGETREQEKRSRFPHGKYQNSHLEKPLRTLFKDSFEYWFFYKCLSFL